MTAPSRQLLEQFASPPAEYRPMPLWVWNGEVSEARITEMLEQFAALGFGGVFVHPRPGLITEYLSDRWFELWDYALRECERLGLICNIYDENSYPAGFAGGHVPATIPYAAGQALMATIEREPPATEENPAWAAFAGDSVWGQYYLQASGAIPLSPVSRQRADLHDCPVMTLVLGPAPAKPWNAGFPYVDLTRPQVARTFIETTYEPYRARFEGNFRRSIRAFFCDEPLLFGGMGYTGTGGLPMSHFILREFRSEHGYDLKERLADLFVDQEEAYATRFDYYHTLQRLWTGNFLRPLSEWCSRHGVDFTGHFMEHEWPYPYLSPSCMHGYRWMHMPGVDVLAPQFEFDQPQRSSLFLLTVRELDSVANQLGRERRLCEAHGVGGYEATFEQFKRLSDWLMVNGVNFICQHLSFQTIAGARKYDHPQTFSDHSPWWRRYGPYNGHLARLSLLLSRGHCPKRVLVLQPTTSGWIHANPMRQSASPMPNGETFGGFYRAPQSQDPMAKLRVTQTELIQWLCDHQVDFDLGDELIMRDHGRVADGQLHVGAGVYKLVVLPAGMDNWCQSTQEKIAAHLEAGGRVLALGPPPPRVNGRPSAAVKDLAARYAANWTYLDTLASMQERLDQLVPPLIRTADGGHLGLLVGHQMRRMEDCSELHFLTNSGVRAVETQVQICGASVLELDTFTGTSSPLPATRVGDQVRLELQLPPGGHVVWLVSHDPSAVSTTKPPVRWAEPIVIESFKSIERAGPNALGLDFCDLSVAGSTHRGVYVTRANKLCWQAHGFAADVWDRQVQFRDNHGDFEFEDDSGFEVEYGFMIDPATFGMLREHGQLSLAVERPDLYQVKVNGVSIAIQESERWLDEDMGLAAIGDVICPGPNRVSLIARPFHMHCEIDRVILLGEFSVQPAAVGFMMTAACVLSLGDWTRQGLPMYSGSVRYTAEFAIASDAPQLAVQTPQWAGAVIDVELDGERVGQIAYPPYALKIARPVTAGRHELCLTVVGTLKNLFGPHFCKAPLRNRWNGPNAWEEHPAAPPAGEEYEIIRYGLLGPVHVIPRA